MSAVGTITAVGGCGRDSASRARRRAGSRVGGKNKHAERGGIARSEVGVVFISGSNRKAQTLRVTFKPGQLVQVYRSDLDYAFKAIRKLEIKWSAPGRVVSCAKNSYKLETLLERLPIGGRFSSRRLRRFIPRDGTSLQEAQKAVEDALELGEDATEVEEKVEGEVDVGAEDVAADRRQR
ncbi:hypothetical protein GALMADRAFT_412475 [Galerina marginata CBS 339.88]|uniref:Uncharacterized protein n=1 Tax=Galerina marginata (strain CBS 339.88) TaxID=685588 RepID=A0A067T3I5_GALM3|nr:hypothetical protein GALMADRAFT_412475 [Galerina marginata CBS 339.88]